jgi:NitT/TauT family transport system substrate-binding protein
VAAALSRGLVGVLAACGSDSDEDGAADLGGGDPSSPEVTDVSLAGIRAPGLIPLEVAAHSTETALTISPYYVDNSGVAVTSVVSGDAAAVNTSYFGVIDAINQGLDLVVIAEGWASTPETGSLETLPDSGIESLADLEGRTVNVISLNSSHAIKLRHAMLEQGLDPDAVDWVELPYGEVAAALEQGTVDASSATGPSLAAVRGMGSSAVFDYGADEYEGMAESGWVASRQFVEDNPNTIAAIQCALFDAQGAISDDRDFYNEQFVEFLDVPLEAAEADIPLNFQTENRLEEIQRNADIYFASGRLTEEFDFAPYVLPTPDNC